jgi:hypothetical protein
MAHRLEYDFNEADKMELWRLMPRYGQDVCFGEGEEWTEPDAKKLSWVKIISAIVVMLDASRQSLKQRRIHRRYALLNARHVLGKVKEE